MNVTTLERASDSPKQAFNMTAFVQSMFRLSLQRDAHDNLATHMPLADFFEPLSEKYTELPVLFHNSESCGNGPVTPSLTDELFSLFASQQSVALPATLELLQPQMARVRSGEGTITNQWQDVQITEIASLEAPLPFGFGETRFVDADTLRLLFNRPNDTILRKVGEHWQPIAENHLIDLLDPDEMYMLGAIQIYS